MYAITFDMDAQRLQEFYHAVTYTNAYADIGKTLSSFGFYRRQGSVYFADGDAKVDAVTCVLAAQELARIYPWFAPSVRDIRMLRIEDNNDLLPAVEKAIDMTRGNRP